MSVNSAPEVGSVIESFAMVARDRATGLIDAVVMTEAKPHAGLNDSRT